MPSTAVANHVTQILLPAEQEHSTFFLTMLLAVPEALKLPTTEQGLQLDFKGVLRRPWEETGGQRRASLDTLGTRPCHGRRKIRFRTAGLRAAGETRGHVDEQG